MLPAPQTLTLESRLEELPRLMNAISEFARGTSANAADVSALQLALEEIVTNVIAHSFRGEPGHSLTITLEALSVNRPSPNAEALGEGVRSVDKGLFNPNRLRAVVEDAAAAFNPLARAEVNTHLALEDRPLGGLGVHLVKKLMDACLYERLDGRNRFTIERHLGRPSSDPTSANIATSKFQSTAVLALTGRLDGLSSPELERQVGALLASGVHTLIFDLEGLHYVSSAGLRVFILAAKKSRAAGGEARFACLRPPLQEIFQISGLLQALSVWPSVESARRVTPFGASIDPSSSDSGL